MIEGIWFATCLNAMFGPKPGVVGAFASLCTKAGVALETPTGIEGLCCGTIWQSKGLTQGLLDMTEKVVAALWEATEGGRLPVVCEAASCTHQLTELAEHLPAGSALVEKAEQLVILDSATFALRVLAPRLEIPEPFESIAVHPTCSMRHLGIVDDVVALAGLAAREVFVPLEYGCCGFAGDRGMLHPELTAAATAPEAASIHAAEERRAAGGVAHHGEFTRYVSDNRTCELGMSRATGRPYVHILEALDEVAV